MLHLVGQILKALNCDLVSPRKLGLHISQPLLHRCKRSLRLLLVGQLLLSDGRLKLFLPARDVSQILLMLLS